MLLEPVQPVECDNCGNQENIAMTSLARNSWDNRNLTSKIHSAGWFIQGDKHYCCEDCAMFGAAEATHG
jgi:hypothetical protein